MDHREHWQQDLTTVPSSLFPPAGLRVSPRNWYRPTAVRGDQMVVYDLSLPGREHALLIVSRDRRGFPVAETPLTYLPATGGWQMGAWRRGDLLFVLAVEQGGPPLGQFVQTPPTA